MLRKYHDTNLKIIMIHIENIMIQICFITGDYHDNSSSYHDTFNANEDAKHCRFCALNTIDLFQFNLPIRSNSLKNRTPATENTHEVIQQHSWMKHLASLCKIPS